MSEVGDVLGTPIPLVIGEEVYKLQRFCPAIEEAHSAWLMVRVLKGIQKMRRSMTDEDYALALVKIAEHDAASMYSFTSENFQDSLASKAGAKHVFYQCLKVHQPKMKEEVAYQLWEDNKAACSLAMSQIWGKGEPAEKPAS